MCTNSVTLWFSNYQGLRWWMKFTYFFHFVTFRGQLYDVLISHYPLHESCPLQSCDSHNTYCIYIYIYIYPLDWNYPRNKLSRLRIQSVPSKMLLPLSYMDWDDEWRLYCEMCLVTINLTLSHIGHSVLIDQNSWAIRSCQELRAQAI